MAAGYVEPSDPVVREALKQRAVGIAAAALSPVLDAAVARGLSREEVLAVAESALMDGPAEGTFERIAGALDQAVVEKEDR